MAKKNFIVVYVAVALTLLLAGSVIAGGAFAGDRIPRMTATDLLAQIDSPDVVVIDVRRGKDWDGSEKMIKNAVRKAYNDVDGWAGEFPKDKTLVLYCA